jgi:DNA-binding protein H-NS
LISKREKEAKQQQEKLEAQKKKIDMIKELQKDKEANQLRLVREVGAKDLKKDSEKDRILKDINNRAHQLADKYKYKPEVFGVKEAKD